MIPDNVSLRWRRSMTAKVVAMLTLIALAGCGAISPDPPRHLSETEAQQMAVSRFKNYNSGTRAITATIRDSADVWTIKGWYDFENDVGYASLTDATPSTPSTESGPASAVLLWSKHLLFSQSADGLEGKKFPPLPAPAVDQIKQTWNFTQYQPNLYAPQAALLIIASLGFDRPENPLLLQQSDALWLRDDHIGETHVNVFAGPTSASVGTATPSPGVTPAPDDSTIRYWLNDSGLMLRVEMRLGGTKWSSVDLHSVPQSEKPHLPALGSLAPTEQ